MDRIRIAGPVDVAAEVADCVAAELADCVAAELADCVAAELANRVVSGFDSYPWRADPPVAGLVGVTLLAFGDAR